MLTIGSRFVGPLGRAVGAVLLVTATTCAVADQPPLRVPPRCQPFDLRDVRLIEGPFKESQDAHAAYLLKLDPDRLVSRYRVEAGLQPKAPNYPGWEQQELPGVGAGFYLSGCSRMYAATGDRRFLARVEYVVNELEQCQEANGNGYLLATKGGKRIFAEIERGDIRLSDGWLVNGEAEPYYALEKLFAGLRDAWRVAGVRKALEINTRLGDWLERHMSHLSDDKMQQIMSYEFGGMNWALVDLHADTGEPRFLSLSRRWDHKSILDPLSRGQDILPGQHANTQFPKISGLAARYPFSADPTDRATAEFFWDRVVHHHSFVTGDNSTGEHFGEPDKLNDRLSAVTTETCNAWNMVRLTSLLFAINPRAEYAEFTERVLWNHVLAAQHPRDARVCYYVPLESGHAKPYESLFDRFACCTCSGFDSYARHGDSIYFHAADELYVNLYIASELHWRDQGLTLRQETRLPDEDVVRFRFALASPQRFKLALRHPRWVAPKMSLAVNGAFQSDSGRPGDYVVLDREWKSGDTVEIKMPSTIRVETMPDNPRRVAFLKGPIVLAGDLGPPTSPEASDVPRLVPENRQPADWLKPAPGGPLRFQLNGVGRPRDVSVLPFFRVTDHYYVVYWDVLTSEQWTAVKRERDAELARRKATDARTVDRVIIGDPNSEKAHRLTVQQSNTGRGAYGERMDTHWRDAPDGWFSYELGVAPDRPVELVCTYWGKEVGPRTFDVLVDGRVIATTSLDSNHPADFYDQPYHIAKELTHGKKRVIVTFHAHPQNTAGGVFGVRVIRVE
jgi:uncharacterized protein